MKRLRSLITIQKQADNLRDFNIELEPSDDFVCTIYLSLKTQCPQSAERILSCHGKLLHGNCILMSCSSCVRSRRAIIAA